jgi:hypothetical protein
MNIPMLADYWVQRGDSFTETIYLLHRPHLYAPRLALGTVPAADKVDTRTLHILFRIRHRGKFVKMLTNNGVGGITCADGRFTIHLSSDATQAIKPDKYQYECILTDAAGNHTTFSKGAFRIGIDPDVSPRRPTIVGDWENAFFTEVVVAEPVAPPPNGKPLYAGYAKLYFASPNGSTFRAWANDDGDLLLRPETPNWEESVLVIEPAAERVHDESHDASQA